jgi:hypothetical protein
VNSWEKLLNHFEPLSLCAVTLNLWNNLDSIVYKVPSESLNPWHALHTKVPLGTLTQTETSFLMSHFAPCSTTPNLNSSDDPQNNRFALLDMSQDKSQAGPSTSTLDNQLASAMASHLRTSSIKQPTPDEAVRQVAANIISTLDAQYQASLNGDSSSNSPMTNMDHALCYGSTWARF